MKSPEKTVRVSFQEKNILTTSWVLTGGFAILALFGLYVTFVTREGNLSSTIFGLIGMALFAYARGMARRGRLNPSGWILIVAIPAAAFLITFFDPGSTWIIGPTVALIATVVASNVLDSRTAGWGMLAAIFGGSLVSCNDIFTLPAERFSIEFTEVSAICVFFCLIFVAMVTRRFMDLSLRVKMLFLLFMSALLSGQVLLQILNFLLNSAVNTGTIQIQDAAVLGKLYQALVATNAGLNVVFALVGLLISKALVRPLETVTDLLNAVSTTGDTTREVNITSADEFGNLARACNSLVEYLRDKSLSAQAIAEYDLTHQVICLSEKDVLGQAFQSMTESLTRIISGVAQNVQNLKRVSSGVLANSQQSTLATGQIAETIGQVASGNNLQTASFNRAGASMDQLNQAIASVARGANEQVAAVTGAAQSAKSLSQKINEVAAIAQEQARESSEAASITQTGVDSIADTITGMQGIQSRVNQSSEKVRRMGESTERIGTILETIDDIASQTNMLALNAAIESARAGEHGKGFAVVADEVRKLAERSAQSTREISGMVHEIQQSVSEAISAMNESIQEANQGMDLANRSGQALSSIRAMVARSQQAGEKIAAASVQIDRLAGNLVSAMDTVSSVVEENTAATEEMSANSNEVILAVESISAVSQENSAASEEVAASARELSEQARDAADSAHDLAQYAEALFNLVSQYRLPDTAAPEDQAYPQPARQSLVHHRPAPVGPRSSSAWPLAGD
jgi:methyl-accepting chemotaxis protein